MHRYLSFGLIMGMGFMGFAAQAAEPDVFANVTAGETGTRVSDGASSIRVAAPSAEAGLAAQGMDYAAVYEQASPSVVFINAVLADGRAKSGSGFVVAADGHILTSRHVVWDDAAGKVGEIRIFLKPARLTGRAEDDLSRRFTATLVREDAALDLALLKLTTPASGLVPLAFADESAIRIGAPTAAIGHPEGGARWSLTTGQISGQQLDFQGQKGADMIQMETPLNPGNSGGPLLDRTAHVVGVNTAVIRKGASGVTLEGINLALKGSTAAHWLAANAMPVVKETAAPKPAAKPEAKPQPPAKPGKVFAPDDFVKDLEQIDVDGAAAAGAFEQSRQKPHHR